MSISFINKTAMPTVLERINKINYTQSEIDLSPRLEEIIFKINLRSKGEFTMGAKLEEIIDNLAKNGLQYHSYFILNILKKMKHDYILQEIDGKWFSTLM